MTIIHIDPIIHLKLKVRKIYDLSLIIHLIYYNNTIFF
jgi:hypothetical protein